MQRFRGGVTRLRLVRLSRLARLKRPFTRLHGKLALSYALTTLLALLIVELVAIVSVFAVINLNLAQIIRFSLQEQAQQLSPYFVHGAPDHEALGAWMRLPNAFAGGTYQHGFLAIVDGQGRVIAAAGDAATPPDTPLPARLPPHARDDLRRVLAGKTGADGAISRDAGALTVAAPIMQGQTVQGAIL
jgi:NarL family two-component system sensor histidine kinase LiaS